MSRTGLFLACCAVALCLHSPFVRGDSTIAELLSEAEEIARSLESERPALLNKLAALYAKREETAKATALWDEAVELAAARLPPDERADESTRFLLAEIAESRARAGDISGALKSIDSTGERYYAYTLFLVVEALVDRTDFNAALEMCDRFANPKQRADALQSVASGQADAEDWDGAFQTVALIKRMTEQDGKASSEIVQAREAALYNIVKAQCEHGKIQDALQCAERLTVLKSKALQEIARSQAKAGDMLAAKQALENASREAETREMKTDYSIAWARADVGDTAGALEIAEELEGIQKGELLLLIASVQHDQGEKAAASKTFESGMAILRAADANDRMYSIGFFASKEAAIGQLDRAVEIAELSSDNSYALQLVVDEAVKKNEIEHALRIADAISAPYHHAVALQRIGVAQGDKGEDTLMHALESAMEVPIGGGTDVIILSKVGRDLRQANLNAAATDAFAHARLRAEKYAQDEKDDYVCQMLERVSRTQAAAGDVDGALDAARSQNSQARKAHSLVGVAAGLVEGPPEP